MVSDGPALVSCPVRAVVETEPDHWILDAGWAGVRVVEGPVTSFVGPDGEGVIHYRVEAGSRAVISSTRAPWVVGVPSSDLVEAARLSRETGARLAREKARGSVQPVGWLRGVEGEPALSVRLNQKCEHPETQWTRRPCGHAHCRMCDGFVHPVSRVALSGPGPVI